MFMIGVNGKMVGGGCRGVKLSKGRKNETTGQSSH